MSNNMVFGITLKADGSGFVGTITQAEGALHKLGGIGTAAGNAISKGADKSRAGIDASSAAIERLTNKLSFMGHTGVRAWAAMQVGQYASTVVQIADEYTGLQARLKLATASQDEFNLANKALFDIAQRNGVPLNESLTLFSKLSPALRELGMTQQQTLGMTDLVGKSLRLSGANAANSAAAMLQFSQALGSGTMRGDEFNSLMENAPRLMTALAEGLHVPIGALRGMAEQGQLTAEKVTEALLSQKGRIEQEFTSIPLTVSAAWVKLGNAVTQEIGNINQASSGTRSLASSLGFVTEHTHGLVSALGGLSAAGSAYILIRVGDSARQAVAGLLQKQAALVAERAATLAAAEAAVAHTATQRLSALGANSLGMNQTALTVATRAHTAALEQQAAAQLAVNRGGSLAGGMLAMLGGPIGMITLALGAGVAAWLMWGNSAKEAADKVTTAVSEANQEIADRGLDARTTYLRKEKEAHEESIRLVKEGASAEEIVAAGRKEREFKRQVQMLDERKKNQAAQAQGDSSAWDKLHETKAQKQAREIADLNTAYLAQINVQTAGQSQMLKLAEQYQQKKQTILNKTGDAKNKDTFDETVAAMQMDVVKQSLEAQGMTASVAGEQIKVYQMALKGANDEQLKTAQTAVNQMSAQQQETEAAKAQTKAIEDLNKSAVDEVKTSQSALDKQREHNALTSTSSTAWLEMTAKRLEDAAATNEQTASVALNSAALGKEGDAQRKYAADLQQAAKNKRDHATAIRDGVVVDATAAAAKESQAEWKKVFDSIEGGFKTAFTNVLTGSKGVWISLRDSFKSIFIDYIYASLAKPFVVQMIAATAGSMGASGLANAAQSAMGLTGEAGAAEAVASMGVLDTINSGFTTVAGTISGALQSAGVSASTAGAVGVGGAYLGAGAMGVGIGSAIAGDKKIGGLSGTDMSSAGAIAGAIFGGPIGAAIGGAMGGVINAAFGKGEKKYEQTALVGKFDKQGFSGDWQSKWSQSGGWFSSGASGVDRAAVTDPQSKAFKATVDTLQATYDDLGRAIGDTALQTRVWSVEVNQAGDVTATLANAMGAQLVPELKKFQLAGEDLAKTAQRMTNTFQSTSYFMNALGLSSEQAFGAIGILSAKARDALIGMFSGTDSASRMQDFNSKVSGFVANFLTEADKLRPALDTVGRTFAELGVSGISTNAQFAARVKSEQEAAARASAAGDDPTAKTHLALVARLLGVADAFNTVTSAATATGRAAQDAAQAQFKAAVDAKTALATFAASTRDFMRSLVSGAQAPSAPNKEALRAQFAATNQLAQSGDVAAQGRLQSSATAFLDAAKAQSGSLRDYARDFAFVQNSLADTASTSEAFVSAADRALSEAQTANGYLASIVSNTAPTQNNVSALYDSLAKLQPETAAVTAAQPEASTPAEQIAQATQSATVTIGKETVVNQRLADVAAFKAAFEPLQGIISQLKDSTDNNTDGGRTTMAKVKAKNAGINTQISAISALAQSFGAVDETQITSQSAQNAAAKIAAFNALQRIPATIRDPNFDGEVGRGKQAPKITNPAYVLALKDYEALPAFASGGTFAGGLRIVGERGPELEATGPSRILSNSDLMSSLRNPSTNNEVLVAEIRALRAEVARLRTPAEDTARSSRRTADTLVRVTRDGDALVTEGPVWTA